MKIDKPILTWKQEDLELLRDDPYNLEDMNIEYKIRYNGDADELRKDIVSFANSTSIGYILFGIKDDPFELNGLNRNELDNLKNVIDHVIHSNIDPRLDPPPIMHPIPLSNEKYIFGIEIISKQKGIYAIRKSNNPNKPDYLYYSFWVRSDGRKRQLSMEEVNSYIIITDPYKKYLKIKIDFGAIGKKNEINEIISISGVNKSVRPIVVKSYGFLIFKNDEKEWYSLWFPPPDNRYPTTVFNTPPNTKLLDGESCSGYYPITLFKEDLERFEITLPTIIKGFINTNDGPFYSKEKEINADMFDDLI